MNLLGFVHNVLRCQYTHTMHRDRRRSRRLPPPPEAVQVDAAPILEVRDVVKDFGGVRAVDHCSFDVMPGSITGLIGPNGAGKTTMFNLVSGAISPTGGRITFYPGGREGRRAGYEIRGLGMHRTFGLGLMRTFQIPREMKRMTVLENLMLVPAPQLGERLWASWFMPWMVSRQERRVEARALEVLELVNLSHLANEYAGNLSGGQKKLLELGRTLMANPRLVLLDEPGAGVNRTLLRDLSATILRASAERDITFVIIEHDMRFVMSMCDPVIVMANGAVIAQGAPDRIQQDPEVLEAYLRGPGSSTWQRAGTDAGGPPPDGRCT